VLFYQHPLHQLDAGEEGGGFEENDVEEVRQQVRRKDARESGAGDIYRMGEGEELKIV